MVVLVASGDDKYRKPNVGMWNYLTTKMISTDIKSAFYCGDAAGRIQDFSDSDLQFANNIHIPFYEPEKLFSKTDTILSTNTSIAIFVGMPGAGKTTYYETILKSKGYIHLSQDKLKNMNRMLKTTEKEMQKGVLIAIDATNPTQAGREKYYKLADQYNYKVTVLWFVGNGKSWNKLRQKPVPNIAYNVYASRFNEPTTANTPGNIYEIN